MSLPTILGIQAAITYIYCTCMLYCLDLDHLVDTESWITNSQSCRAMLYTMLLQVQTFGPPAEERAHGSVSMKTYYKYFVAGGGYILLAFSVFVFIIGEVRHSSVSKIGCLCLISYFIGKYCCN